MKTPLKASQEGKQHTRKKARERGGGKQAARNASRKREGERHRRKRAHVRIAMKPSATPKMPSGAEHAHVGPEARRGKRQQGRSGRQPEEKEEREAQERRETERREKQHKKDAAAQRLNAWAEMPGPYMAGLQCIQPVHKAKLSVRFIMQPGPRHPRKRGPRASRSSSTRWGRAPGGNRRRAARASSCAHACRQVGPRASGERLLRPPDPRR